MTGLLIETYLNKHYILTMKNYINLRCYIMKDNAKFLT